MSTAKIMSPKQVKDLFEQKNQKLLTHLTEQINKAFNHSSAVWTGKNYSLVVLISQDMCKKYTDTLLKIMLTQELNASGWDLVLLNKDPAIIEDQYVTYGMLVKDKNEEV